MLFTTGVKNRVLEQASLFVSVTGDHPADHFKILHQTTRIAWPTGNHI